jgi:cobalt-zinc-cadmium efflux system protein
MAYAADRVRQRPGTDRLTYAYGRWEVLVALINAVALIAVSAVIVYAAVGRLLHPSPVNGPLVMAFALVSLVGNALAAWILQGERSVNARSAFLHLAGDAAASGAVLVGGLLIWLAHLDRVDPVLSIAIAAWITRGAIKVIVEAGRILLEGVPVGLDLADVEEAVLSVDGVAGVHDLHVWSVSSTDAVLSAHVQLADGQLSGATRVVDQIKGALATSFGVYHATLEVECVGRECADGGCVYAPAQVAQ